MTRSGNAVVALWLVLFCATLMLVVAPASAVELPAATSRLDLRLEEAVAAGRLGPLLTRTATAEPVDLLSQQPVAFGAGTHQQNQLANLRLSPSRVSWQSLQDTEDPAPTPQALPKKKRRPWLIRHWYVPVLAVVAVYVLVDESKPRIGGVSPPG